MINIVFKACALELKFFDLLIRREINFLLYAIYLIVKAMVFIEHFAEMIVRALQAADDFAMLWKLSKNWMMKVHGNVISTVLFCFV